MKTIRIFLFSAFLITFGIAPELMAQEVDNSEVSAVHHGNSVVGDSKSLADDAYVAGDYEQAIILYEQILDNQGEAAAVYYNLGNSY